MVVTKASVVKTTTAGIAVPMHSIAGDASTTVTKYYGGSAPDSEGSVRR
jgi:hypothetical protein